MRTLTQPRHIATTILVAMPRSLDRERGVICKVNVLCMEHVNNHKTHDSLRMSSSGSQYTPRDVSNLFW